MNVAEVLAEVIRITARPDKSVDALASINKAVAFCTLRGAFRRDLVEASIVVDSTLYGDTISISSLLRFRRFTTVKPTAVKYCLVPTSEEHIFTPKNQVQPNRYYVAGTSLTYTLSVLTSALEVSYLTYAPVLDATVNNTYWMLDMMPYAIIDLACAKVFDLVGDDSSASKYEKSGMEFFLAVQRDQAVAE